MTKWEQYDKDSDYLLSNGWIKASITYRIPDDEDYQDVFVKENIGLVYCYYWHTGWHKFKFSDANYHDGLPYNFESIDIYEKTI